MTPTSNPIYDIDEEAHRLWKTYECNNGFVLTVADDVHAALAPYYRPGYDWIGGRKIPLAFNKLVMRWGTAHIATGKSLPQGFWSLVPV